MLGANATKAPSSGKGHEERKSLLVQRGWTAVDPQSGPGLAGLPVRRTQARKPGSNGGLICYATARLAAPHLSIVIPVYNEASIVAEAAAELCREPRRPRPRLRDALRRERQPRRDAGAARAARRGEPAAPLVPLRAPELRQRAEAGHPERARRVGGLRRDRPLRPALLRPRAAAARARRGRPGGRLEGGQGRQRPPADGAAARDPGAQRAAAAHPRVSGHRHPRAEGVRPRAAVAGRRTPAWWTWTSSPASSWSGRGERGSRWSRFPFSCTRSASRRSTCSGGCRTCSRTWRSWSTSSGSRG